MVGWKGRLWHRGEWLTGLTSDSVRKTAQGPRHGNPGPLRAMPSLAQVMHRPAVGQAKVLSHRLVQLTDLEDARLFRDNKGKIRWALGGWACKIIWASGWCFSEGARPHAAQKLFSGGILVGGDAY